MDVLSEALREWLQSAGRVPNFQPLQQLLSLCQMGLLPRSTTLSTSPSISPGLTRVPNLLSTSLVRLLDGSLTIAAALPDHALRHAAASNILAAFCQSALREAHLRGRSHHRLPPSLDVASNATATVIQTFLPQAWRSKHERGEAVDDGNALRGQRILDAADPDCSSGLSFDSSLDTDFLDAAFSLLAAVVLRHPLLTLDLRMLEVAWGAIRETPVITMPALRTTNVAPGPCADGIATDGMDPSAAPDARPGAEGLAGFLLSDEFQCRLAAGQLLFGELGSDGVGSCGGSDDRSGDDPMELGLCHPWTKRQPADRKPIGGLSLREAHGTDNRRQRQHQQQTGVALGATEFMTEAEAVVLELCEVPVLAELCASAALADMWPHFASVVADGGADAGVRWLAHLAPASTQDSKLTAVGDGHVIDKPWEMPVFATCDGRGGNEGDLVCQGRVLEANDDGSASAGELHAVSQRCCKLIAAALALSPEALLGALPPQMLCVLAVRSCTISRALLDGLAASLAGLPNGMEDRAENLQESTEQLRPRQPAAQHLRCLAEWFLVLGWDLGKVLQQHVMCGPRAVWAS